MYLRRMFCVFLIVITAVSNIAYAEENPLALSCPSAILMDSETGTVLYEHNSKEKLPMASVTKVMTMLLAMEEIDKGNLKYTDMVTGSAHAKEMGGSTIFLDEGESLSVSDMLKGIAVASGNDAAVAMAEHIGGSEENFVNIMNNRAKELGMENTHFVNCNGLDTENHYSCAYDIALMSRELMKHEDIFKYTTIWMDTLRDGKFILSNTNKLVRFYDGATGLKTGSTDKAKFCISATAKRDNMHLIAVIMAAPSSKERNKDASNLLNYGFSTYGKLNVITKGEKVKTVPLEKGTASTVNIVSGEDYSYLYKKSDVPQIKKEITIKNQPKAPVQKNQEAGVITIYDNGKKIAQIPGVFDKTVKKTAPHRMFVKMLKTVYTK